MISVRASSAPTAGVVLSLMAVVLGVVTVVALGFQLLHPGPHRVCSS